MNHRLLFASPALTARRSRLLATTAVVAVLATAMTVLLAPAASAAPQKRYDVAGYINPYLQQPGRIVGTDCTATVGAWKNDWAVPGVGWAASCDTNHTISVWATLWVSWYSNSFGSQYVSTDGWLNYSGRSVAPAGLVAWEYLSGSRYWTMQITVAVDGVRRYVDFGGYRQESLFLGPSGPWTAGTRQG
jgi:hypothetical protein